MIIFYLMNGGYCFAAFFMLFCCWFVLFWPSVMKLMLVDSTMVESDSFRMKLWLFWWLIRGSFKVVKWWLLGRTMGRFVVEVWVLLGMVCCCCRCGLIKLALWWFSRVNGGRRWWLLVLQWWLYKGGKGWRFGLQSGVGAESRYTKFAGIWYNYRLVAMSQLLEKSIARFLFGRLNLKRHHFSYALHPSSNQSVLGYQVCQCPRQHNGDDCGYFVMRFVKEIIDHKQKQTQLQDCPRQRNGVDCGYFVMRFVKEIIDHKQTQLQEVFFRLQCSNL